MILINSENNQPTLNDVWGRGYAVTAVGVHAYKYMGLIQLTIYSLGNNKSFPLLWRSG